MKASLTVNGPLSTGLLRQTDCGWKAVHGIESFRSRPPVEDDRTVAGVIAGWIPPPHHPDRLRDTAETPRSVEWAPVVTDRAVAIYLAEDEAIYRIESIVGVSYGLH